MNLIEDEWIPVRRRSGKVSRIAPWQVTDGFAEDPFIELAAPRPDFNGALIQFLIGLLQTCFAPEDRHEWRQRLRHAPTPEDLNTAFLLVAPDFSLNGNGPRFLQDLTLTQEMEPLEPASQEEWIRPVGDILIDVPTGKTLRDNTDLFVKRNQITTLCLRCAATALFALQTNAPEGGRGYLTGIRGGGPLTTLVLGPSLWATIWLNVLERTTFLNTTGNPAREAPAERFPWLGPTRTNEDGRDTTPEDAHPAQVFWTMPRRIRLMFSQGKAECDLCGEGDTPCVSQYQTKTLGVKYRGWHHPLSPYSVARDGTLQPRHARGAIGYRHWLGLVQSFDNGQAEQRPAAVLERYLRAGSDDLRLWAFGYDMDHMKARCWYDATMPLLVCPEEIRESFAFHIAAIVKSAELAASETRNQLRKALFRPGGNGKRDLSFITGRYWQETEPGFYSLLPRIREVLRDNVDVTATLEHWHKALVRTAERIFDDVSQTGAFDAADPKRIALAWRDLQKAIYGKKMRQTLGLPDKPSKNARAAKRREG